MAEIKLDKNNFTKEVLESDIPVLVDFWAEWCGPCQMLLPIVEEIAEEYEGEIKVGKVNVDENPDLAEKYQAMYIPMLLVFEKGKIINKSVGYKTKTQILALLNR